MTVKELIVLSTAVKNGDVSPSRGDLDACRACEKFTKDGLMRLVQRHPYRYEPTDRGRHVVAKACLADSTTPQLGLKSLKQ